jgi:hypothetical protein
MDGIVVPPGNPEVARHGQAQALEIIKGLRAGEGSRAVDRVALSFHGRPAGEVVRGLLHVIAPLGLIATRALELYTENSLGEHDPEGFERIMQDLTISLYDDLTFGPYDDL